MEGAVRKEKMSSRQYLCVRLGREVKERDYNRQLHDEGMHRNELKGPKWILDRLRIVLKKPLKLRKVYY